MTKRQYDTDMLVHLLMYMIMRLLFILPLAYMAGESFSRENYVVAIIAMIFLVLFFLFINKLLVENSKTPIPNQ